VAIADPDDDVIESDEQNNEVLGRALVPAHLAFLPLTMNSHP
jgi:hypothetical protein